MPSVVSLNVVAPCGEIISGFFRLHQAEANVPSKNFTHGVEYGATTLSITTQSRMTLCKIDLNDTQLKYTKHADTQHNGR
jgi:hypothetical protein